MMFLMPRCSRVKDANCLLLVPRQNKAHWQVVLPQSNAFAERLQSEQRRSVVALTNVKNTRDATNGAQVKVVV